jgi:hypothetical protein
MRPFSDVSHREKTLNGCFLTNGTDRPFIRIRPDLLTGCRALSERFGWRHGSSDEDVGRLA